MKFLLICLIFFNNVFIILSSNDFELTSDKKFEDYSLSNFLFLANLNNNSLILKNYDNTNQLNIKYENFYEENKNLIDYNKINFNYILYDEFDIYRAVLTVMDTNNIYFEALNTMSYSIHNYEQNSLKVSLFVMNYKFQDINNEFIINLSFNSPVNYDGEYYLEAKEYIIVFSEEALLDNDKQSVYIKRFGNNFYINFPSFKDYLLFNYTIYYNNYN